MMTGHPDRHEGRLVVLEGPDGMGKTTLARAFHEAMRARGANVLYRSFPGTEEGSLGRLVYRVHHEPDSLGITRGIHPVSRQVMHVAAHIDALEREILPSLREGFLVILDRFWWSTWVYGVAAGIDPALMDDVIQPERRAWGARVPDDLILVYRDAGQHEETEKLWRLYEVLAEREASHHRVHRMRNDGAIEEAVERLSELGRN